MTATSGGAFAARVPAVRPVTPCWGHAKSVDETSRTPANNAHGSQHRQRRQSSPGSAQIVADAGARSLDQELSRASERDRDAALLRGHARPAAGAGRYRNAADADEGPDDRRQEAHAGADPARRGGLSRRHAGPRSLRARRAYRPLSQP